MKEEFLDIYELTSAYFFACKLPGQDVVIRGNSDSLLEYGNPGFVVMPFSPDDKPFVIPEGENAKKTGIILRKSICGLSSSREEHRQSVIAAIECIGKDPKLRKLVISRVEYHKRNFLLSELFDTLCDKYPSAFVFCFGTPETGIWIGASPELLLRKDGTGFKSVSLAGTRPSGSKDSWNPKNLEEQEIVTLYIEKIFRECGLTPVRSTLGTKTAGPVEHLYTEITAVYNDSSPSLPFLLSPTPALSGYPKSTAVKIIRNIEKHRRGCYGGFSGIYRKDGSFDFYVNLRSINVDSCRFALYAGGGITSLSDPDSEWEETCNKAKTLLDLTSRSLNIKNQDT